MPKHRLLAALAAASLAPAVHALDLTVEVVNPKQPGGALYAALFKAEDGWMKTGQAHAMQTLAFTGERATFVYRDLPPGRYALSVYHDENGNGQLDKNVVGIPRERIGFTRDARGRMGPPSFADAAIEIEHDHTAVITLY